MPSHLETARSGLSARSVRNALNAPMLPNPAPSAPRLIIDIYIRRQAHDFISIVAHAQQYSDGRSLRPPSLSLESERSRSTKVTVKVKLHTLDTAPLLNHHLRSIQARVLNGSHSFTYLHVQSAIGMSHTCLCLPRYSWYSFTCPNT